MEIIQDNKPSRGRFHFLWLLLIVNIVLVAGLWQYHRLIVEVSEGAASDIYRQILRPFQREQGTIGQPLRVALFQSEATAASFGEHREGYFQLIELWQQLMKDENFWYRTVNEVPSGVDADAYNLLVLPATRCIGTQDREAVKEFLRAGKGVVMSWATGTRNEFGLWENYSLLHEVGGMEISDPPPFTGSHVSTVMVSGGYPITANLYPGFKLNITAFDQPVSASVREARTEVDGVWTDPEEPTFELHSVRDRAAIVHGFYGEGRFVWTGFTISSGQNQRDQRDAMRVLLRSSMLWAGHQIQAFKPAWPDRVPGVISITQDILNYDDVRKDILDVARRHRVRLTSFVRPEVLATHPETAALLMAAGEIGLLGDPDGDYQGRSLSELKQELRAGAQEIKRLTGQVPRGFRLPSGANAGEHLQDALVQAGFRYFSVRDWDRLVPRAVRSYRPIALVTRPRVLWSMPETPYLQTGLPNVNVENTLPLHFSQILALAGLYNLSFRPSHLDAGFPMHLDSLIEMAKLERVPVMMLNDVADFWEGWDHVRIATRFVSARRTSLKISNTFSDPVDNVVINVEMPAVVRQLDIESMTLGTSLPDRLSNSGVRWQLHLDRLGAGKNVVYYINMRSPSERRPETGAGRRSERAESVAGEVW